MPKLAQLVYCLYCIWPALIGGVAWWMFQQANRKAYFGSMTSGVDPVSPQGQAEFDTRRLRDAEQRKIIYWAAGIIVGGFLLYYCFTLLRPSIVAAAPMPTATRTLTRVATKTGTATATSTATVTRAATGTPGALTGTVTGIITASPTTTPRVIYLAGSQVTVVVTRIIYVIQNETVVVTATFTSSPTPTLTPTLTPSPTLTSTLTPMATETQTATSTETATDTPDLEGP